MCNELIHIGNPDRIQNFIKKIEGKKPLFICVIGNTDTGKISGISAAGANPEITDFTPAADMEYLHYNKCKSINGVPVTPDGIPTPALITKAALDLGDIPYMVVVGGAKILPKTPYIDLGGVFGTDISSGNAVKNPKDVFEKAKLFGENISKVADYLVIGESIAGGTTTALSVLLALGYNASNKISSSLPYNPLELKLKIINEGFKKKNAKFSDFKNQPFKAIEYFGDPMQPACVGIVVGAAKKIPIILAGGTQMAAIAALVKLIDKNALENLAIGTTKWIIKDPQSDLLGIMKQIDQKIPILGINFNFSSMKYEGLRVYEEGIVKEGVGAGGTSIACILYTKNKINIEKLQKKIEEDYEKIITN